MAAPVHAASFPFPPIQRHGSTWTCTRFVAGAHLRSQAVLAGPYPVARRTSPATFSLWDSVEVMHRHKDSVPLTHASLAIFFWAVVSINQRGESSQGWNTKREAQLSPCTILKVKIASLKSGYSKGQFKCLLKGKLLVQEANSVEENEASPPGS